jgi:hypothetical protein|tara:strand:+ start:713 stop:1138 length:426 start_codon:yes stop_codon:yes gene_type:complete
LDGPKYFRLLQALTLLHIIRIIGINFILGVSEGLYPEFFGIRAGVWDVSIAVTAPLVLLAIRRGALLAWVSAIVWNVLGLTDNMVNILEVSLAGADSPFVFAPQAPVLILILISSHIISMTLLMRRNMRTYFAKKEEVLED